MVVAVDPGPQGGDLAVEDRAELVEDLVLAGGEPLGLRLQLARAASRGRRRSRAKRLLGEGPHRLVERALVERGEGLRGERRVLACPRPAPGASPPSACPAARRPGSTPRWAPGPRPASRAGPAPAASPPSAGGGVRRSAGITRIRSKYWSTASRVKLQASPSLATHSWRMASDIGRPLPRPVLDASPPPRAREGSPPSRSGSVRSRCPGWRPRSTRRKTFRISRSPNRTELLLCSAPRGTGLQGAGAPHAPEARAPAGPPGCRPAP